MAYRIQHTETEILDDLKRVMDLVGHYPSYEDVRKHGAIHPHCAQTRLGPRWSDVKRKLGWIPVEERQFPELPSDIDIGWLCGIIDGEGCFRLQKPTPRGGNGLSKSFAPVFETGFRLDDKPMADEISRIINCSLETYADARGRRSDVPGAKPAFKIWIRDLPTLMFFLIPLIEKGKLRSKKKYEFAVFRFACEILWQKRAIRQVHAYTDEERILLQSCHNTLHEMKVYMSDKQAILEKYGLDKYVTLPS